MAFHSLKKCLMMPLSWGPCPLHTRHSVTISIHLKIRALLSPLPQYFYTKHWDHHGLIKSLTLVLSILGFEYQHSDSTHQKSCFRLGVQLLCNTCIACSRTWVWSPAPYTHNWWVYSHSGGHRGTDFFDFSSYSFHLEWAAKNHKQVRLNPPLSPTKC
jgi:hypothetical protein